MSLRRLLVMLAARKARNAAAWEAWDEDARARIALAGGAVTDAPREGLRLCREYRLYEDPTHPERPTLRMGVVRVGEWLSPDQLAPYATEQGDAIRAGERRLSHLSGIEYKTRKAIRRRLAAAGVTLSGIDQSIEAYGRVEEVALALLQSGAFS